MPIKLYVIHGSHPAAAVARALEMKGLAYEVVELLPPLHFAIQRVRFGAQRLRAVRLAESIEHLGHAHPCTVDIALKLTERLWAFDQRAVGIDDGIP